MKRTLWLPVLFLTLAWRPAAAAEFHTDLQSLPQAGSAHDVAASYLRAETRRFDLASVDLVHQGTLALGEHRTVRFGQVHEGLPVLNTAAALRVAPDGRVTAAALQVARDLRVSPTPTVGKEQVRELLAVQVDPRLAAARLVFTLAVLPGAAGEGRLVWQVDAAIDRGWRYVVDAHHAELLDDGPLAVDVLGRVYPISSVKTPTTSDVELLDLVSSTPQVLTGWSGQFFVTNYVSGSSTSNTPYGVEQTLNPNSGADFLYDPPADVHDTKDGFAQVMLYYHVTRMRDFFHGTFGVDFTSTKWSLLAIANGQEAGAPLDNAFFSPYPMAAPWNTQNLIVVGQGTKSDFAIDSDVFLHEFTHYVSDNAINYRNGSGPIEWGRTAFAGSIDEGTADYFACSVNGDPALGEASLALLGPYARHLDDTHKVCPTDMYGEAHEDGEIIGSISWTLHEAFGKATADKLVWGAMTLLVPGVTFGDYGKALVQTGNDLVSSSVLQAGDIQTINDALAARGLDLCFNEIPLQVSKESRQTVMGLTIAGEIRGGRTCAQMKVDQQGNPRFTKTLFHYATTTEDGDAGIKFKVQWGASAGADLNWRIYGRKGQHVGFTSSGGGGYGSQLTAFDWVTDPTTSSSGEMVVDANSTPAFEAGQSYHFLVMHQNCPDEVLTVSYDRVLPPQDDAGPPPQDDAGTGADAGSGGNETGGGGGKGCGCRSAGTVGLSVPVLLLGLLLLSRRRWDR